MKKSVICAFILLVATGFVFAQNQSGANNSTNPFEVKTVTEKSGIYTVVLEFTPVINEARVYCYGFSNLFNEGDAQILITNTLRKFAQDNPDYNLGRYEYFTKPVIKVDNINKLTYFIATVAYKPL